MTDDGLTGQLEPTHQALWDAMEQLLVEIPGPSTASAMSTHAIVVDFVSADRSLVVLHGEVLRLESCPELLLETPPPAAWINPPATEAVAQ